jgi:hypothetical protein
MGRGSAVTATAQLNRALHIIVQSRIRYDGPTRDYVARRTTEGKTGRESKRCVSRATSPATSTAYSGAGPISA